MLNVMFQALICLVDKKTGDKSKTRPRFVKQDQVAIMRVECAGVICMEQFKLFPQMGRFTLRDEGKVTKPCKCYLFVFEENIEEIRPLCITEQNDAREGKKDISHFTL